MEEFGKHLRYNRKQRRMTQTELAHIVGVAPAYVSQIESSLRMPSLKVAKKFADALRVELPALLGSSNEAPTPDRLTDTEKLELLQNLIRSIEFDTECRPRSEDVEPLPGATAMEVSDGEESVVRFYRYGDSVKTVKYLQAHPGQEIIYCASGRLRVVVENEEQVLAPGESFSFDSERPHTVLGEPGSVGVSTANPPPTKETVRWIPVNEATGVDLEQLREATLSAQTG